MKAKKIARNIMEYLGKNYPSIQVSVIPKDVEFSEGNYEYWRDKVGIYLSQPYDNYKKKMVLVRLSCNDNFMFIPIFLRKDKNACEYFVFENAEMNGGEFHTGSQLLAESIEQQFVDFLKNMLTVYHK